MVILTDMERYPKDLEELVHNFSAEEAYRRYLFQLRWPEGFICPACKHEGGGWSLSDGLIKCKACGRKISIIAETVGYYLDEYTFRFNRRTSRSRSMLFYRLLQNTVAVKPVAYKDIALSVRGRKRNHKM